MKAVILIVLLISLAICFKTIEINHRELTDQEKIMQLYRLGQLPKNLEAIFSKFMTPHNFANTWPEVKINNYMDA